MRFSVIAALLICNISASFVAPEGYAADKNTKDKKQKIILPDEYKPKENKTELVKPSEKKEDRKVEPLPKPQKTEIKKEKVKLSASDFYEIGRDSYLLFNSKGYRQAIKDYDKALAIEKNNALLLAAKAEAQALLSRELANKEDQIEIITLERQAFENAFIAESINPKLPEAHRALSMAYFIQERYKEGFKEAEKAISLNEDDAEAHLLLWLNTPDKDRLKSDDSRFSNFYKALNTESEIIDQAIELNPKLSLIYLELGTAYASQEKFNQSIEYFETAIELNPENERAYTLLGFVNNELARLNKAIEMFDKALEIEPKRYEALHGKGIVYLKKKEKSTAIELFTQACASDYEFSCEIKENLELKRWRNRPWNRNNRRFRGRS